MDEGRGQDRRRDRRAGGRVAVLPGARASRAGWRGAASAATDWLKARLFEEAEAGRFALWLPVAFGAGAVVYFAAGREPALAAAIVAFGVAAAIFWTVRRGFAGMWLALGLAFVAAGFLAGKLATVRVAAPVLARPMSAEATGRAVLVEPRKGKMRRLTVAVERFGALDDDARPARVRVTLGANPAIAAGDRISLTAYWRPPEGPVRPGGYDFARVSYFAGLGATGFGARDVRVLPPDPDAGLAARFGAGLERLRASLTARIASTVGGPEGAVAAALVTGVQGPIPEDVENDLRAAGLSHILSISGLHMALVAGALFWLVRAGLALSARAALGWPVKQISAVVALTGATFYLALSGAEVATQRSYVMIAVAFLAVIVGRPALAPRNFALAALIVVAWTPEAVLGPSFQMSFAAVAGLVAWFEARRDREPDPPPATRAARMRRALARWAALALMTTVVAGLATAPFAAYHFHRVTPYAIAGNALAEPILGLIVMPSVIGGLALAPLGLDGPFWRLMGLGLEAVLAIAKAVASWPGSERNVPAFGDGALILFVAGLAWLCLWRTALRWLALPVLGVALALAAFPDRPDVAIEPSGRSIAARGPDGALAIVGLKPSAFASKVWLAADAAAPPGDGAKSDVRCDALGCLAPLTGGGFVSVVDDPRAFDEDCRRAVLVVTRLDAPAACARTVTVIDRRVLDATGALTLERKGGVFTGRSARDPAGARPWIPPAGSAPLASAVALTFAPSQPPVDSVPQPVDPTDASDEAPPPDDDQ